MKNNKPSKTSFDDHRKDSADRHYVTLLTVDPVRHTATVLASDNNRVLRDIPIIKDAGNDGGGTFSTPEPGWRGLITDKLGMPALEYCFPPASYFSDGHPPEYDDYAKTLNTFLSLTGAAGPYRKVENGQKNFRAHRPYDLLAGDQGFRTSEGASVFALRGGVAGIKVDDLCQILLNQVDHLTRIVSRNFDLMTDGGLVQSENLAGATTLRVKANSTAANTYEDAFEFEMGLGANASKAFIDWKLKTKNAGDVVASQLIDQKGTRVSYFKGDDLLEVNGHQGIGVTGAQKVIVGADQDIEVDGKHRLLCSRISLGDFGGERAPMGEELVAYLKSLKFFIDTQIMVMTPLGASTPGAFMMLSPQIPDMLSNVVDYIKN